jgi:MarR family transcriptional regulator, lower aerobic nicotinate degradation pathway regulator
MGSHASAEQVRAVLEAVRRIVRALRESSRQTEMRVGISGAQLFVLQQLDGARPLSASDLVARTLTHQSSVSVVVQRLVDAGLVARATSASDARRMELRLTPRGHKLLRSAPPLAQERLIDAVQALPASRRAGLAAGLQDVVARMRLANGPPTMFFEERGAQKRKRRKNARR